jgi:hypothetical protein
MVKCDDVVENVRGRLGRVVAVDEAADTARVLWVDGEETHAKLSALTPQTAPSHTVPRARKTLQLRRRFAAAIQEAMDEQNLTWDEVVRRTGVSRATLARGLRNQDKHWLVETIEAVSTGLGIPPEKFWSVSE